MSTDHREAPAVETLPRPGGHIAYEVSGSGPLVVLVPGMGDLRATYRFIVPGLVDAGFRVAATDLRGHGDSDVTFASYGDAETAEDLLALVEHLGGPAILVGNSMGAGAAALAAAQSPDLITGLVLIGPFVRDGEVGPLTRAMLRVAMAAPWAPFVWKAYLPKLYAGRTPDDFEEYSRRVVAAMRRPGYARAFSRTTRTSHSVVSQRLGEVRCPTLVVMGEDDPDFRDPRSEAEWIADTLHGRVLMVQDAGHYPQSQQPQVVLSALLDFLGDAGGRA